MISVAQHGNRTFIDVQMKASLMAIRYSVYVMLNFSGNLSGPALSNLEAPLIDDASHVIVFL